MFLILFSLLEVGVWGKRRGKEYIAYYKISGIMVSVLVSSLLSYKGLWS